jgi:hypothetical protein
VNRVLDNFLSCTEVILITIGGAIVMWNLVEKRFLFHKSHYIEAVSGHENVTINLLEKVGKKL